VRDKIMLVTSTVSKLGSAAIAVSQDSCRCLHVDAAHAGLCLQVLDERRHGDLGGEADIERHGDPLLVVEAPVVVHLGHDGTEPLPARKPMPFTTEAAMREPSMATRSSAP
jgi:hypothetical protein